MIAETAIAQNLRGLANAEHNDLTVAEEAADELDRSAERLRFACSALTEERKELETLRNAFRHIHVAGDEDRCAQCGLNLRNPIHQRGQRDEGQ